MNLIKKLYNEYHNYSKNQGPEDSRNATDKCLG